MEINEYEAGMLDAVLEAFAGRDELDWSQLLELFDGDEELAAAITDILAGQELVIKAGEENQSGLPEKIIRTDAVTAFLAAGGFTAQVKKSAPEPQREIEFSIENKLPEEKPAPEEPAKPSADVLLHQEIALLRFDQRNFEHQLREMDIAIENLKVQNQILGRFRLFIWILLGIIVLLAVGLIFHKP